MSILPVDTLLVARETSPERLAAAERAANAANTVAQSEIAAKQSALASARTPLPSGDGQVIDVASLQAKISAAEADLATARANAENVRTTSEQAIAEARFVLVSSPDLADRTRAQASAANAAAERDVAAKQAALDALRMDCIDRVLLMASGRRACGSSARSNEATARRSPDRTPAGRICM